MISFIKATRTLAKSCPQSSGNLFRTLEINQRFVALEYQVLWYFILIYSHSQLHSSLENQQPHNYLDKESEFGVPQNLLSPGYCHYLMSLTAPLQTPICRVLLFNLPESSFYGKSLIPRAFVEI